MAAYFAYGSDMDLVRLEARVGTVAVVGTAVLRGCELRFTVAAPGDALAGLPTLAPHRERSVWGVLYLLTPEQLTRLDQIEGLSERYRREAFRLRLATGDRLEAEVYLGTTHEEGRLPSRDYLAAMLVGAREHGLPAAYRARLERQATCD